MRKISPPRLSTAFSESGKSAKRRLGNILNTRPRRIGAAIILSVSLLAIAAGAVISLRPGSLVPADSTPESSVSLAERLIKTRHPYVGSASDNGLTASVLGIAAELGGFTNELQTDSEPYGWRLNFEKPPAAQYDKMPGYAAVLLALVDNLGYVEWDYGDGAVRSLSAESASELAGMDIKTAADSEESMSTLLSVLNLHDYSNELYAYLSSAAPEDFAGDAIAPRDGETDDPGRLNTFLNLCALKSHAYLNILSYTDEGDPILQRLVTDGESFWCGEWDGYDRYREDDSAVFYFSGPFSHLKIENDNDAAYFYLVNDPGLSIKDIHKYLLSSAYTPDRPKFRILFFLYGGEYGDAVY